MVGDVACHPVDDQMLFVTQLSGDAVLRSQDGGATFGPFSNGLENVIAPRELAFAGDSRLLLASAKGSYATNLLAPTPTPTATPNATPTPSMTPTATPRATPVARPRPTPAPSDTLSFVAGSRTVILAGRINATDAVLNHVHTVLLNPLRVTFRR